MLGELLAQEIEARTGLKVERRFYLAGSYICQQALVAGRIDGYVEYTGTALTAILKQPVDKDRERVSRHGAAALPATVWCRRWESRWDSRTLLRWSFAATMRNGCMWRR